MRESGSFAVFSLVSLSFMPCILAQKDFFLAPPSGCGAFNPGLSGLALLYDALPFAFKPPFGFWPSLRCHAGVFAIQMFHVKQKKGAGVAPPAPLPHILIRSGKQQCCPPLREPCC